MGKYIDLTLLPNEKIQFETRYHWVVFFGGFIGFLLIALLTITSFGIMLVLMLPIFLVVYITRATSEFVVTNKRVVIKSGWLFRRTIEMVLTKVESIDVVQTPFGRWLNYGNITVIGTGGSRERFRLIEQPLDLRKAVQQLEA